MLFGVKFGNGRWANTSSLGNGFTRVARIKQGEDGVLLSKREGSDHDGVVVHCPNTYTVMLKKPNRNRELQRSAITGQCIYA